MAIIKNIEGNIETEIMLINNDRVIIDNDSEFESWIPFKFELRLENKESYNYSASEATFTLFEIREFIAKCKSLILIKSGNKEISDYSYSSSEGYFEIIVSDPYEENELLIDIWLSVGTLTDGKSFGYDKGFRFGVELEAFSKFIECLEAELNRIL